MPESHDGTVEGAAAKLEGLLDPGNEAPEQPEEQDPSEEAEEDPGHEEDASSVAEEDADGGEAEEEKPQESDEQEPDETEAEEPQLYTVKVNGEEIEVPLEEALKGYSRERDYIQKTETVAAERKQLHEAREAAVNEWRERFQTVNALVGEFDEKLTAYNGVDWEALMRDDPEEAIRLDLQRRVDHDKRQRFVEAARQQGQTVDKEILKIEETKLFERIPEWQNPTIREEQGSAINAYLKKNYQATNTALNSLADHRIVDLSRKAMLYDELMAKTAEKKAIVQKKAAKAPKMSKPGAGKVQRGIKEEANAQSRNRLRKSGTIDAAASLFERMLSG